ncbi:hypothetical protein ACLOAV_001627 [Pseudogymnoascus australis]
MKSLWLILAAADIANAMCPYAADCKKRDGSLYHRQTDDVDIMKDYTIDDSDVFLTSDVGGAFSDQNSLSAGERGPSLLEDFIFRQKTTHFDHERVPERAMQEALEHMGTAGKKTTIFVRFSTVAGSRGSADTARDVHGFATRFYTDEGNFDIVGNNIAVFFIQDAILFPDLVHAVKPSPDNEIPQGATAHDSAWDFFSQQLALYIRFFGQWLATESRDHTDIWMADDGKSKLIKWHWKTLQGKVSLVWEETQVLAGKNADYHRRDLWDAVASGNGREYELGIQVVEEEDVHKFGFDLLDPTKIIPEEMVPVQIIGKMTLNRNPHNYFAETEQVMFQPGHIVRVIDFTDDPLLQGRIFSYLDTQLNRHGGPNFEQLPINRPVPHTLNGGCSKQADQATGRGFFTAPGRTTTGNPVRAISWSRPRLFFNSLIPVEQQFLINAIRFEVSLLQSSVVKQNVILQLNRVSNDLAKRVAQAIGLAEPEPDSKYYHNNSTTFISIFNNSLPTIATLKVGVLASTQSAASLAQAKELSTAFAGMGVGITVIGETLASGVNQTYSAADATSSCLETDNRLGSVGLLHGQPNLEAAIKPAREDAAIPAVAVLHEVEGSV